MAKEIRCKVGICNGEKVMLQMGDEVTAMRIEMPVRSARELAAALLAAANELERRQGGNARAS